MHGDTKEMPNDFITITIKNPTSETIIHTHIDNLDSVVEMIRDVVKGEIDVSFS